LGNEADIFAVETGIYQLLHCGVCFGSAIEQTNNIRHSDSPSYDAWVDETILLLTFLHPLRVKHKIAGDFSPA
jgi:hypothetical protein